MNTSTRMVGDVAVVSLSGKLMGGPDADALRDIIKETLEKGTDKILMDIGGVSWVNSTGLGILIASHVTVTNAGGQLKLCRVNNRITQLFMVTQLQSVFETFDSEEEALKSFAAS
ncbi:MAG: anti-sigma factor antagonist [Candidatus Eisenbacteria bacterium]|nr:anti-sigma factor antagonist [Candidatus Eisenbacteria bacterium]